MWHVLHLTYSISSDVDSENGSHDMEEGRGGVELGVGQHQLLPHHLLLLPALGPRHAGHRGPVQQGPEGWRQDPLVEGSSPSVSPSSPLLSS